MNQDIYDFVIIGSGFGGSVSAMRLSQKGYSVAVLEMGKHYGKADFPKSNWNIKKYLWAPIIRCFGIQKITLLKKLMVLHGVGVGGGSLVYANTLLQPENKIFTNGNWPKSIDWLKEMSAPYERAKKMLGVTTNPHLMEAEDEIYKLSQSMNAEETYHPTEVGVYFSEDKDQKDPYFNGDGPDRSPCTLCGSCMIGCPEGAKNTLDKNYLYFAMKWGAKIFAQTKVTKIIPTGEGYNIEAYDPISIFKKKKSFKAKKVILAAGVMGSIDLLFKNKIDLKTLPNISDQLGESVRTNGESLLGSTSFDNHRELSKGIAIGAQFKPNPHTKIEGVRYPEGSSFMKVLAVPLTGDGNAFIRPLKLLMNMILRLPKIIRLLTLKNWAGRSIILLVMQSIETKMSLGIGRSIWNGFRRGLVGKVKKGEEMPSFIPIAQDAVSIVSKQINGEPQNCSTEVLLGTPATAHILGGAVLSDDETKGVVDINHEVYGHHGLFVCDASVIPANLAVNPSLTITALAERFCEQFPKKLNDQEIYEISFSK